MTSIQEQDTTERILEHRCSWSNALLHRDQGRQDLKVREVANIDCIGPPPGQRSTVWEGLPWASDSPSGERDQEGSTSLLQLCGSLFTATFTMISHHGDYRGIHEAQSLEIWLWQRRGVGFATTSTWGLANAQLVIPTQQLCSSAEPSQGYTLNRKLGGCTLLTDLNSQVRSFADLRAQFAHTWVGCRVTALPAMESAFKLDQTRKASDDSWKVCGQGALEQRGRQSRLFVLRAKPVLGLKSSHATGRGLIYNQSLGYLLAPRNQRTCLGDWW